MKKTGAIFASSLVLLTVLIGSIIYFSDSAFPGRTLYSIDRGYESIQLYIAKVIGKTNYALLNLELAQERLLEISDYQANKKNSNSLVFKANAQVNNPIDEVIKILLNDFNINLEEALNSFNSIDRKDNENFIELAENVSKKTTEYGNTLASLISSFNEEEVGKVDEIISQIEELDDDAVEALLESDDEDDDYKENNSIKVEKVTKRILKASERLNELEDKFNRKSLEDKLTEVQITEIQKLINEISLLIEQAQLDLTHSNYSEAYIKAKEALSRTSKGRDMLEGETKELEEEDEDEREESEDDDKNEKQKRDSKNRNNNESKRDDTDKQESSEDKDETSNSGNRNDDDEDDEEDDDQDDDDDIKGEKIQPYQYFWLRFYF